MMMKPGRLSYHHGLPSLDQNVGLPDLLKDPSWTMSSSSLTMAPLRIDST